MRQESENAASTTSQASLHSSQDSQLQGQDTPAPEPDSESSSTSEATTSKQSSLTLSPADSPLRGIHSTGSLQEIDELLSDGETSEILHQSGPLSEEEAIERLAPDDIGAEFAKASISGRSHETASQSQGHSGEDLPAEIVWPADESQSGSSHHEGQGLPCSSNALSGQASDTESELQTTSLEVEAYPVDPTPETQPCTPVSQPLSASPSSQQISSPFSQAESATAGNIPAAVEDLWDAASSDGSHTQTLATLQTAQSLDDSARSSGETASRPQKLPQKPRRRSLTYGIIRGANRADAVTSEEDTAETRDSQQVLDSMTALSLEEHHHEQPRADLLKQSSLHNGDSGHLTFNYARSKTLSPTDDETRDMLAGLSSQNSGSEAGDWVGGFVSSLKAETSSPRGAATS